MPRVNEVRTASPSGLYLLRVRYPEPAFVGPDPAPKGRPGVFQT